MCSMCNGNFDSTFDGTIGFKISKTGFVQFYNGSKDLGFTEWNCCPYCGRKF